MKNEYKEIDKFLKSYNAMKRKLAMLEISLKYYENDIDEEIESQSVGHPAICDNIGAGRNISVVSKKTENIALNLDDYRKKYAKNIEEIFKEVKRIKLNLNVIDVFYYNLQGVQRDIFKMRYYEELSNEAIANKLKVTSRTILNKLNKVIKEFADTYNAYIKI